MATVYQSLPPGGARVKTTNFAVLANNQGTNFPVESLKFDPANDWDAFWRLRAVRYGTGNLTVDIDWYADTATSGDAVWIAQLAAVTADVDTGSVEAKGLAAANTVTDTHLGTTAKRLHRATVTVTNLDGLAVDDAVWLRVARDADNVADSLAGFVFITEVTVSYSDT